MTDEINTGSETTSGEEASDPIVIHNTFTSSLNDAQRAKIERNRQKALLLKQARLTSRPLSNKRKGYFSFFCCSFEKIEHNGMIHVHVTISIGH